MTSRLSICQSEAERCSCVTALISFTLMTAATGEQYNLSLSGLESVKHYLHLIHSVAGSWN